VIKQVESKLKDKKVKFFRILDTGTGMESKKERIYLKSGETPIEFWAYFQAITGGEYSNSNAEQVRRQAIYIVNYNEFIDESYFLEDCGTGKIYNIKYIDRKEGYLGSDLKLSVTETQEANDIE
jgi:hypothetical protein